MGTKAPVVTINTRSIQVALSNGEIFTIPFHSISYYAEMPANSTLNAARRLRIVTIDGSAHPLGGNQIDTFKANYTTWLNSTAFTL